MRPNFALKLSHEGIALLHRTASGWMQCGSVLPSAPDLGRQLQMLRRTAAELESGGLATKLVLPDSQTLYTQVHAPGPGEAARIAQIREALDGMTPYEVDELVFDWTGDGSVVHVAVVARETLREAEAFAVEHRFNPVSFAAAPKPEDYPGEPAFGATEFAARLSADGTAPSPAPSMRPAAAPAEPPAPTPAFGSSRSGGDAGGGGGMVPQAQLTVAGRLSVGATAPHISSTSSVALAAAAPVPQPLPDPEPAPAQPAEAGTFASRRHGDASAPRNTDRLDAARPRLAIVPPPGPSGEAATEPPTAPAPPPIGKQRPRMRLAAVAADGARKVKAAAAKTAGSGGARPGTRKPVGSAAPAKPKAGFARPKVEAAPKPPAAPPQAAEPRRRDDPFPLPGSARRPATGARVAPPPGIARPVGSAAPLRPGPNSSEAEALTIFGARGKDRPGAPAIGARGIGLALTGVLVAVFLAVAMWSLMFGRGGVVTDTAGGPVDDGTVVASAPDTRLPPGPETPLPLSEPDRIGALPPAPVLSEEAGPEADGTPPAVTDAEPPAPDADEIVEPAPVADTAAADLLPLATAPGDDAPLAPSAPAAEVAPGLPTGGAADATPGTVAEAPAPEPPSAPPATAGIEIDTDRLPESAVIDDGAVEVARLEQPGPAASPRPEGPEAPAAPEALPRIVQPLSREMAEARYAATGIWQLDPAQGLSPRGDRLEDVYIASIDPVISSHDAVALPKAEDTPGDRRPVGQAPPAPAGTSFDLDERGLVRATPEGALSPGGVQVFSGRPPVVPGLRPATAPATPEPAPEVAPEETERLRRIRPVPRPEDLIETNERGRLGGRSRVELAAIRPAARPESVQVAAEGDDSPTDLAIIASVMPRSRPEDFDRVVQEVLANRITVPDDGGTDAGSGGTARSVAPAAVPAIPTRANVAREATEQDAIRLGRLNLIGVYGSASDRRALVRLSSGRYVKVKVGDRIDGGRVAAIGSSDLRYVKRGRTVTLKIPSG